MEGMRAIAAGGMAATPASELAWASRDGDLDDAAGELARHGGVDRLQIGRSTDELVRAPSGTLEQDRQAPGPTMARLKASRCRSSSSCQGGESLGLDMLLDLTAVARRRRAGPGAVFEGEGRSVADVVDQAQRGREVGVALAREADDEVPDSAMSGRAARMRSTRRR